MSRWFALLFLFCGCRDVDRLLHLSRDLAGVDFPPAPGACSAETGVTFSDLQLAPDSLRVDLVGQGTASLTPDGEPDGALCTILTVPDGLRVTGLLLSATSDSYPGKAGLWDTLQGTDYVPGGIDPTFSNKNRDYTFLLGVYEGACDDVGYSHSVIGANAELTPLSGRSYALKLVVSNPPNDKVTDASIPPRFLCGKYDFVALALLDDGKTLACSPVFNYPNCPNSVDRCCAGTCSDSVADCCYGSGGSCGNSTSDCCGVEQGLLSCGSGGTCAHR